MPRRFAPVTGPDKAAAGSPGGGESAVAPRVTLIARTPKGSRISVEECDDLSCSGRRPAFEGRRARESRRLAAPPPAVEVRAVPGRTRPVRAGPGGLDRARRGERTHRGDRRLGRGH